MNNALPQTPITMPRFGNNRMNLHGTAHYSVDPERSIASNYRTFTARNTGHSNYSISCTSCTLQVYIGNHYYVFSLSLIKKKKRAARIWIACLCLINWSQFIAVLSTVLRCRVAANSWSCLWISSTRYTAVRPLRPSSVVASTAAKYQTNMLVQNRSLIYGTSVSGQGEPKWLASDRGRCRCFCPPGTSRCVPQEEFLSNVTPCLRYQCTPKSTILPHFSHWYSQVHLIEFFQLQKVLRKKVSPRQSYNEKMILWINYLYLEAVNKLSWSIKAPLKVT